MLPKEWIPDVDEGGPLDAVSGEQVRDGFTNVPDRLAEMIVAVLEGIPQMLRYPYRYQNSLVSFRYKIRHRGSPPAIPRCLFLPSRRR